MTPADDAEHFADFLRTRILPGFARAQGYRGAYVMRREIEGGFEFVTLTLFDSREALQASTPADGDGADARHGVRELLAEFEQRSVDYEIVVEPD